MTADPSSGERLTNPPLGDPNATRTQVPGQGADQVAYLRQFVERCWTTRERYKEDQSKILIWAGTLFIATLVATGFVGALRPEGPQMRFGVVQFLIFATVLVIVWCYFKYKQLSTDLFDRLGTRAEAYLRRHLGVIVGGSFMTSKKRYIGRTRLGGRSLAAFANLLLVLMGLCLLLAMVFDGVFDADGFRLSWGVTLAAVCLIGALISVEFYYRRRRRQLYSGIDQDWPVLEAEDEA